MDSSWGRDQWLRRDPEEWAAFPEENVMADDDKRRPAAPASKPGLKVGEPKSGRAADAARPRAKGPAERPFDMWLQKQLHAMYDEIAGEPLPNDLLNLIDHDAAKTDDGGEGGPGKPGKKA
jgi:hypothetical protein